VHRSIRVTAGSKLWPDLLPQMEPGRKHERPIVLAPWQRAIVDAYPWPFVRGLIHSDGCHTVNRFKTLLPSGARGRVRLSALLLQQPIVRHPGAVLRELRAAGLRWTQSNHRNISISHRASVALLDEYVGPKC
jgi:hypothetical protein